MPYQLSRPRRADGFRKFIILVRPLPLACNARGLRNRARNFNLLRKETFLLGRITLTFYDGPLLTIISSTLFMVHISFRPRYNRVLFKARAGELKKRGVHK